MTTFLLVRHATCAPVGHALAGRAPGVRLDAAGEEQARRLGAALARAPLTHVYSSPLERAWETAVAIAAPHRLPVEALDAVTEIDVGAWTGSRFDALAPDPWWRRFNTLRSVTRPPAGELMLAVQARVVAALEALREAHPDGCCAVVSHADVIRGALAHLGGVPLDLAHRFEIAPASVTTVGVSPDAITVLGVNRTVEAE